MYLFLKWLHFVSLISWMAGILYLYRLLIYQAERGSNPDIRALLDVMAGRLYRIITVPAMIVAFVAGTGMLTLNPALLASGWLHVKFLCLLGMVLATLYAGALVGRFQKNQPNVPSGKRLRLLNEVPTLLLLIIVAMAVFRPF